MVPLSFAVKKKVQIGQQVFEEKFCQNRILLQNISWTAVKVCVNEHSFINGLKSVCCAETYLVYWWSLGCILCPLHLWSAHPQAEGLYSLPSWLWDHNRRYLYLEVFTRSHMWSQSCGSQNRFLWFLFKILLQCLNLHLNTVKNHLTLNIKFL